MKRAALALVALFAAAPGFAGAAPTTREIDPAHSSTGFSVKHLVVTTVRGHFGKTSGTVQLDEANLTRSKVEAEIDVTTIDTREPDRDKHLQSADFFDAEKFPKMTFKSTKVVKKGTNALDVTGDLTIRDVTKPITLRVTYEPKTVKDMQGAERRAFSATGKLNRQEYGLKWSKTVEAGPVVGDEVQIQIDAELVKKGNPS